jgi:simple sugar transport system ATP-binding protein
MKAVSVARPNGTLAVDDLDLEVYGGEIVCIAGVHGNGQTELAEALLGLTPAEKGTIELDGTRLTGLTPRETIDAGLGSAPSPSRRT